ncbi:hypothetical protein Pen01_46830 [Phytomonospora endophytica]|nr:hypothetical protein Pen01_46830 [Phytomonospora endophytica]
MPAGLAESAAATLVRLMVTELAGVDVGYVGRFAALDTTGDARAVRNIEARLTIDARCLEAALTAGASGVTSMAPTELGSGLHPKSPPEVHERWAGLIEEALARGFVRAAELNAFLAEFAPAAEDGHELLEVFTELDARRRALWHRTGRRTLLPGRDLDELRTLNVKRGQLCARIRSRHPAAVRADRVQSALQRRYEARRAELLASRSRYTSPEAQAGFAMTLEHLDSAHELALRRQSVPRYGSQPEAAPVAARAAGSIAAAVGQMRQSTAARMEEQRAVLVRMRDQHLTAEGRAAYDQAIAQIDLGTRSMGRQPAITPEAEAAMSDEQRRATEQAIADVVRATAGLGGLGAAVQAAAAHGDHMLAQATLLSGLNAELHAAGQDRDRAYRAELNAKAAVDKARLSGVRADHRPALRHYEQARQRHEAATARMADIQARVDDRQRDLHSGLPPAS